MLIKGHSCQFLSLIMLFYNFEKVHIISEVCFLNFTSLIFLVIYPMPQAPHLMLLLPQLSDQKDTQSLPACHSQLELLTYHLLQEIPLSTDLREHFTWNSWYQQDLLVLLASLILYCAIFTICEFQNTTKFYIIRNAYNLYNLI